MILLLSILISVPIYGIYRSSRVADFRLKVLDMCVKFNRRRLEEAKQDIVEYYNLTKHVKPISYEDVEQLWPNDVLADFTTMVYSFKPLKLENWMTQEQINYLKS